jgi:predicted metal-binding membrane protein
MAGPVSLLLRRERTVILAVLVGLSVLAWGLVIWQSVTMRTPSMGGSMSPQASLTMGMGAALFLAIWVAMMIAMMFPASAPMVLMFHAISAGKRQRAQAYVPTWVFLLGYLVVWSLAGVVAFAFASGLDQLASQSAWLMSNTSRIGGVVLIATGLYQLSPLKNSCLGKCRTPTQFIMTSWRDGYAGALRMGIEHGAYCLGCCWLLFVLLFLFGMMNIAAMAVLTILIFAEKVLPVGRRVSTIAGVALVAYGALVVVVPGLLPVASM